MKAAKFLSVTAFVLFLFFVVTVTVEAQGGGTAQISGTIQDSTGAVVPGAEVKITQTGTGFARITQSDTNGSYTFPVLPVGGYSLRVTMAGFNVSVQSGILLEVDTHPTINVLMKVGSITQSVSVEADIAAIDTTSSGVGQIIDRQRVEELPLNGRDPIQMALLAGGTALPGSQSTNFNGGRAYPEAYQISFAGQNAATGTFFLDGLNHNDPGTNIQFPFPFPDALQEFNVQTSAVPAKFGMHSGGVVDAVTKSGDNQFHGDLFEYVRNYIFNARNAFALTRDNLKRNQYGGTVGGPILKDKIFFFTAYQYTSTRSASSTNISFIPTPAMLGGNFAPASSAGCFKGALGSPFTTNHISPSQYSLPAVNLANLLLQQTTPLDECGTVRYAIEANSSTPMSISKIDYHINSKQTLSGRYIYTTFVHPLDTSLLLASSTSGQDIRFQSLGLNHTYLISPRLINLFSIGFNRSRDNRSEGEKLPTPTDLGVQGYYNPTPNYIIVSVPSFFSLVNAPGSGPAYFNVTSPQLSEQFTWLRGKHQVTFGVAWDYFVHNSGEPAYQNGAFNFSSSFTSYALSDFLMGDLANTSNQTNEVFVDIKKQYYGVFAQDSWKIGDRLNLNYGIRWEPMLPWSWIRNTIPSHFEPSAFLAGSHSSVLPLAPAGLTFPGDTGYPDHAASFRNYKQFSPRIGVSFDPRGTGRETIRAAYGIFYDFDSTGQYYDVGTSPPSGMQINFPNLVGGFTNPWAGFTFNGHPGNPFPLPATGAFPTSGSYLERPLHQPSLYTQQWNVSVQKQFGRDWLVSISYLGNATTHIMFPGEANPGVYIAPGNCGIASATSACTTSANLATRRLLYRENAAQGAYFAQVIQMQDDSNASYNGAVFTVQKHLSHGINWLANYTLSHCIDEYELGSALVASVWRNPMGGRKAERGNCTYDRRHNFNTSAVLQMPTFESTELRRAFTGFELAPIFTYYSGDWLTVSTGADNALMGIPAGQRPNITCNPKMSNKNIHAWFNTACFQMPTVAPGFTGNVVPAIYSATGSITVGPIGNLGRDTVEGPSAWNFDLSLSRIFPVTHYARVQVRAEAFNVFNHTRLPDPITTMNSSTFGQITTPVAEVNGASAPQDPRIMQFAMKLMF